MGEVGGEVIPQWNHHLVEEVGGEELPQWDQDQVVEGGALEGFIRAAPRRILSLHVCRRAASGASRCRARRPNPDEKASRISTQNDTFPGRKRENGPWRKGLTDRNMFVHGSRNGPVF